MFQLVLITTFKTIDSSYAEITKRKYLVESGNTEWGSVQAMKGHAYHLLHSCSFKMEELITIKKQSFHAENESKISSSAY